MACTFIVGRSHIPFGKLMASRVENPSTRAAEALTCADAACRAGVTVADYISTLEQSQ